MLHRHPQEFGKESGKFPLELVAQVSFEQGLTTTLASDESVRRIFKRLKIKASQRPEWAIGFLDEVWWSRFALPRITRGKAKTIQFAWWSKPGRKLIPIQKR